MKGRIHRVLGTTGAVLAGVALLAGGVQAAERPNDRAGAIGVGGVTASVPSDVVDRAVARMVPASAPTDVFERAVKRGIAETAVLGPDSTGPVRPDDRPGAHGAGLPAGATPSTVATEPGDPFAWGDAAFGAAATFGLLVALGAVATLTLRYRGRALAR